MNIVQHPSPNHDARGQAVDTLVIHYTDMDHWQDALARLCDAQTKVSAHYLIAEDGTVTQMVDEGKRAWHAGESSWRGNANVNARSIGIELSNPGHAGGYTAFPKAQMDSLTVLCHGILKRHTIPARNVVGHSDIAFLRKQDPGELFDWKKLAAEGIGVFPTELHKLTGTDMKRGDKGTGVMKLQTSLANYGYGLKLDGEYGEKTEQCVIAFQRHFRPFHLDGIWDSECAGLLAALHGLV